MVSTTTMLEILGWATGMIYIVSVKKLKRTPPKYGKGLAWIPRIPLWAIIATNTLQ